MRDKDYSQDLSTMVSPSSVSQFSGLFDHSLPAVSPSKSQPFISPRVDVRVVQCVRQDRQCEVRLQLDFELTCLSELNLSSPDKHEDFEFLKNWIRKQVTYYEDPFFCSQVFPEKEEFIKVQQLHERSKFHVVYQVRLITSPEITSLSIQAFGDKLSNSLESYMQNHECINNKDEIIYQPHVPELNTGLTDSSQNDAEVAMLTCRLQTKAFSMPNLGRSPSSLDSRAKSSSPLKKEWKISESNEQPEVVEELFKQMKKKYVVLKKQFQNQSEFVKTLEGEKSKLFNQVRELGAYYSCLQTRWNEVVVLNHALEKEVALLRQQHFPKSNFEAGRGIIS